MLVDEAGMGSIFANCVLYHILNTPNLFSSVLYRLINTPHHPLPPRSHPLNTGLVKQVGPPSALNEISSPL